MVIICKIFVIVTAYKRQQSDCTILHNNFELFYLTICRLASVERIIEIV